MRYLTIIVLLSFYSASGQNPLSQFRTQPKVVITLNQLKRYEIPKEIGTLIYVEDLTIQKSLPEGQWDVHPPLSWYEKRPLVPPFRHLPESIGDLTQLKVLRLSNLELGELPNSIGKLQNLEVLDVSLNKLNLRKELPKLENLQSLKHLIIMGNHYDESQIIKFKNDHPGIVVEYNSEGI